MKTPAFDMVAARARDGMREMAEALASEADGQGYGIGAPEIAAAIATGTLFQAVELFFGMCVIGGLTFQQARAELDEQIETYWKQAVTRRLTAEARAKIDAEALPPPIRRRRGQ